MQLHTTTNYTQDRYNFLKNVEDEPTDPAGRVYVYADSKGIATIGIGINLRVHGNLVLQTLGFDSARAILTGVALTAENGYIAELRQAFNSSYAPGTGIKNTALTTLNAILARRASDSRYSAFPTFQRTTDFSFVTTTDSKAVFDTVLAGYPGFTGYETQLDNWLTRNAIPGLSTQTSKERLTLVNRRYKESDQTNFQCREER